MLFWFLVVWSLSFARNAILFNKDFLIEKWLVYLVKLHPCDWFGATCNASFQSTLLDWLDNPLLCISYVVVG